MLPTDSASSWRRGGKKKGKLGMISNGGDVTAHTYKEGEDEEEGITAGRRREEDIQ
jgi:hypothetical protein